MKNVRILAVLALGAAILSCGKKTVIEGTLSGVPEGEVIVKLLDVNRYQVLDTVKTDASGNFRHTLDIAEGRPEFIYLFHGDRRIASLLLESGDRVKVTTDTLGNACVVEGSEASAQLLQVEKDYAAFINEMNRILNSEEQPDPALSRCYVDYYRNRVSYVVKNPYSLTVIPVLFQKVNDNFEVFSRSTDGILMQAAADSLKTRYPESRYVQALEKEATRRMNLMDLNARMEQANPIGFFDIELPGTSGQPAKLSEQDGKVVMLYFWSTTAAQKMFNLDALVPIYEEFHPKGFDIYAVSLDVDKTAWASAVRNQDLPWTNVCDTRGQNSPYAAMYGLSSLPTAYFIVNGEIDGNAVVSDAASIRRYLQSKF